MSARFSSTVMATVGGLKTGAKRFRDEAVLVEPTDSTVVGTGIGEGIPKDDSAARRLLLLDVFVEMTSLDSFSLAFLPEWMLTLRPVKMASADSTGTKVGDTRQTRQANHAKGQTQKNKPFNFHLDK